MYDITMASIAKKLIKGIPYYYARECQRVNGKPKIVWQKYLGRADDIVKAFENNAATVVTPKDIRISEFGASTALFDVCKRLKLAEIIDKHVAKDTDGPGVGTYMLVAAINRCIDPCSKSQMAEWFDGTSLRQLVDIESRQLTSQRFWDNMNRCSTASIQAIENELTTHMVREFGIDLKKILFDGTNFFTFIDTFNDKNTLAQRGKSKEGRKSLRIVGLALLVSHDYGVPLLHKTYPGNQHDSQTFSELTADLVERCKNINDTLEEITIVFDKGNNSQENLDAIEASPYHFIGSLVPTHHKDLLAIPLAKFKELDELAGVKAYRTRKEVFDVERTVLVTYNENLFISQTQTLLRQISKRQCLLRELQNKLRRHKKGLVHKGKKPTFSGVEKNVNKILKARHMKDLFQIEITEVAGGIQLTYRFDNRAWNELQQTLLGKTIIFTDNESWSDTEIVLGYRSQYHVEGAFRQIKSVDCIQIRPQYHWTDQKIEVHVFYCVIALMLINLLRRQLALSGIDLSVESMLEELKKIREVIQLFPAANGGKPTIHTALATMTSLQTTLFKTLELQKYQS